MAIRQGPAATPGACRREKADRHGRKQRAPRIAHRKVRRHRDLLKHRLRDRDHEREHHQFDAMREDRTERLLSEKRGMTEHTARQEN
jgi:hypothetical protein